jgi:DNA-binding MurR/RpiR family transcriptional regulator
MPTLSNSEKRVAETVLEQPDQMIFWTVNELGERAGVGDATILRFCRKLGLSGYQEFKLLVAQSLPTVPPAGGAEGGEHEDDQAALIRRTLTTNVQAVEDTTALLDPAVLRQAAERLVRARMVHFFGVGSSGLTAADARLRFMRIGIPCSFVPDPHVQVMDAALMTPDDVAFCITYSGSTKDMLEIIRTAKARGACTIVLTGHSRSPILEHADLALFTSSRELPLLGGAFVTKIAQLHLLDLLFHQVIELNKAVADEASQRTAKAVLRKLF